MKAIAAKAVAVNAVTLVLIGLMPMVLFATVEPCLERAVGPDWNGCLCLFHFPDAIDPFLAANDGACPALLRAFGAHGHGDVDTAISSYDAAARGYEEQEAFEGLYYARLNRAKLLRETGQYDAAMEDATAAHTAATALGSALQQSTATVEQILIRRHRGEDLVVLENELRNAMTALGDERFPELDSELGRIRYELGRYEAARTAWRRAEDGFRERGSTDDAATMAFNLALSWLRRDVAERVEAEAALRRAIEAATRHRDVMEVQLGQLIGGEEGIGRIERVWRQAHGAEARRAAGLRLAESLAATAPDRARHVLDELEDLVDQELLASYAWEAIMRTAWATLPPREAEAQSRNTIEANIETLRHEQAHGGGRGEFFAVWTEAYDWLAGRLFALATDDARLADLTALDAFAGPDDDLGWTRLDPWALDRAFAISERKRARLLLDTLGGDDQASLSELDTVRAALRPDEAMLIFQTAPWRNVYQHFSGGTWLLTVTHDDARLDALPDSRDWLTPKVELFGGLFESGSPIPAAASQALADRLFSRALDALPAEVEHLILVADGALHRLPFGALDGPEPLGLRFRVSYAPSVTVWHRARTARSPATTRRAMVLADPLVDDATLDPLPGAVAEGRAVRQRLGAVDLWTGAEAREHLLRGFDPAQWGALHLAAHALAEPTRSAIALAPGDGDDGWLEPDEIKALDLDGRLVVLSTCHAAAGRVLDGEGPLSLARAFFEAGARAVVAGRWRLDDNEARQYFDVFYHHLARGEDLASAALAARRDLHASGASSVGWAGVMVMGDGAWAPYAESRGVAWMWWLVVALALVGAVLLWVRMRRGKT